MAMNHRDTQIPLPEENRSLHQGPSPASATGANASRTPEGLADGAGFFRTRWRGEAPLAGVFWNDMLLAGTIVNGSATLLAMFLLSAGTSMILVGITYFAPLPFNLFLVVAVWRSAAAATATAAFAARTAALAWLLAATAL
jgi:predicted phage tail protein